MATECLVAIGVAGLCCEDLRRAPVANTSPSGA